MRVYYGPDDEPNGGAGDEPPEKPEIDIAQQLSKTFSEGKNEGAQRTMEKMVAYMRANGIEIVNNDKGKPDIEKSLANYRNTSIGASEAVKQLQASYEQQLAEERQSKVSLQQELHNREIDYRLRECVMSHDPVDVEATIMLLRSMYRIELEDGRVTVSDRNGTLKFDTKTGQPITLAAAVEEYFKSAPYMVKAKERTGVGQQSMKGAPQMNDVELSTAFFNEKDPVKKAALRQQMLDQAARQRSV